MSAAETHALAEQIRLLALATKRLSRRVGRLPGAKRYLTAEQVAKRLGFKSAVSVRDMPEVWEERIYPCTSSTPRWTEEGLARAEARMPHLPRVDYVVRARKAGKPVAA